MADTSTQTTAGADDRSRQRRGEERRQRILDAAVELFATDGFRGTGVTALAKRVEMTAPGLLYYFGTKERLLAEVVAERDRATPDHEGLDLRFSDLRWVGHHNEKQAQLTRLYIVLGAESFDDDAPLHEFFVTRHRDTRAFVRDLLGAEAAAGNLRDGVDIDQIAQEVVALLVGLETQWLTDPDAVAYGPAVERAIDRLAAEILIDPTPKES